MLFIILKTIIYINNKVKTLNVKSYLKYIT